MTKYHSKKVSVNGETFDSRKEYRRFCELRLLERAGQITNLRRQVKFVLIPAQHETIGYTKAGKPKTKCFERECAYVADFVYEVPWQEQRTNDEGHLVFADGWETIVEDTKGFRTKDYIIKRKLMSHVHGIRIKEV